MPLQEDKRGVVSLMCMIGSSAKKQGPLVKQALYTELKPQTSS
jgi:hypothetical protein